VGECGKHARELLRRLLQRTARRVERARRELGQHARLVLCSALRENGGAGGEPIDDDDREGDGERQRRRGERQEHLQAEGKPAAACLDEPRDGERHADEEDDRERGEQFLASEGHVSSLRR
jgi:hypothetical protein